MFSVAFAPFVLLVSFVSLASAQQLSIESAATQAGAAQRPARPLPPRDRGQREAPRGTAMIRGVVVAADSGAPIRRAQVRASASGAGTHFAATDAQGRFELRDLPAGRYTVSASKAGFVTVQYGQRRPAQSGTPLDIADGERVDKLVIGLPRGSVISGRITDEFGEPVANAFVSAMRYGFVAGARRLVRAPGENARDTTDDQGQFRLFGLSPGEYVVSASLRAGRSEVEDPSGENTGYAPTYYPGTTSVAEAERIRVGVGQENNGAVFALIPTRLVRVTGTVVSAQGEPVAGGIVTLLPPGPRFPLGIETPNARIDRTGQFRLSNVPPGRYVLQARAAGGRLGQGALSRMEFGRLDLTVGPEDVDGVVVATAPGGRVIGQIVSEAGATLTLRPQQVTVGARAAQPDALTPGGANARVNEDWTFEIGGLFDPRLFRVNVPQGWYLKAVLLDGADVTDTPVDVPPGQTVSRLQIVLTDKTTALNGHVVDAQGAPVTDVTVVVFPYDEARWTYESRFIRATRPDQDGRFQIDGLPPSDDYLAIAVQGLEDGQAADPEFLASVRDLAVNVSLRPNETKTLELRFAGR